MNIKEKFIDLKNDLVKNKYDEKEMLLGIDILLEVLADKEFVKNKNSVKHIEYVKIHNNIVDIIQYLEAH